MYWWVVRQGYLILIFVDIARFQVLSYPVWEGVHPLVAGNHQFQPYFRDRRKRLSPPRLDICGKSILADNDFPATSGCTLWQLLS